MTTAADQYRALVARLEAIQESEEVVAPELEVEECGDMPAPHGGMHSGDELLSDHGDMSGPPEQQDNITMNVSMNGSGAGGIRELMSILKHIENHGGEHNDGDVVLGMDEEVTDGGFQDATTDPDEMYGDVGCVTKTGNDLASKGKEALKRNGGGNPMQESLVRKLTAHYESVKGQ